MKLHCPPIFKSAIPECHFAAPERIQAHLEDVCRGWVHYLQGFVHGTTKLFNKPELPWEETERALVSTLSASIIRRFRSSLVVEEGRLPIKASRGRFDLWASIPDRLNPAKQFNFYLEAKKGSCGSTSELLDFLKGPGGVSRLYRAYQKRQAIATRKLTPFLKERVHEHYVVGLLVTQLKADKQDSARIKNALHEVFDNKQTIVLRKKSDGIAPKRKRNLGRLPTVAIVVLPEGDRYGMVASFTVFGSTSELLAHKR